MKGITNANNVANSEVNAKQPLLVSGENIKTVNGNSLLGAGNLAIDTYQPFPAGWRTSGTIDQLMADITADNSAVVGMAYLGEVACSDLPFNGNAELIVNIMNGSGSSKVIWAELTSGNISPYFWHYTYWNNQGSGWRSYIPTDLSSGTLVTGIGYDASGNLVKGAIPQPTAMTNQEIDDIMDAILSPESQIISFTIDSITYQAENNMIWADWVNSEYNTANFQINSGNVYDSDGYNRVVLSTGNNTVLLLSTDTIIALASYELQGTGGGSD